MKGKILKDCEIVPVYKPIGVSPLDVIKKIKKDYPFLEEEKVAYAGRLDPMAEGVVLTVRGSQLKNFKKLLKLDKEYEAEVLFGFSSDSYDVLGVPEKQDHLLKATDIKNIFSGFEGDFTFSIPSFSSYRVKGKPLFWWARQGRLEEVEIPEKKTAIYSLEILDNIVVEKRRLKSEILKKIDKVVGDFRQKEIASKWKKIIKEEDKDSSYLIFKIRVSCSSGCYVRSLAHEVGKRLNSGALLFSLCRTKIGDYNIEDSFNFFK